MKNIFLDIDGTILDSEPGLHDALIKMFSEMGWETPSDEELTKYLGPPIAWSLENLYGISAQTEVQRAKKIFQEYYTNISIYNFKVYTGIPEFLQRVSEKNLNVYAASCKRAENTKTQLDFCGLSKHFDEIFGLKDSLKAQNKQSILENAIEKLGIQAKDCVMIGDRASDIHGAKDLGMKAIGVCYGYGTEEELVNVDRIAFSVKELEKLVLEVVEE